MWPQYRHIFIHPKTGILNLFTNGEMVHLWLSKAFVGFIFPPPLYLSKKYPPEVDVSVERVSLRFSDMRTKCLKTEARCVLFLPAVRLRHLTAYQDFNLWHYIKVLSL